MTGGRLTGRRVFIVAMYVLTHGLMLLNRGLFWDDWVFWRQDMRLVEQAGAAMGSTWPAAINKLFFYSAWGITLDRFMTFLSLLVAALLLFEILRRVPEIDPSTAMWTAVLFGIFPAFESRVALVMVGYPLSVAMFMLALWLLVRSGARPPVWARLVSAVLFLGSFHIGSLLVFFAMVPVALVLVDPEARTFGSMVRRVLGFAEQMALPFAYWVVTRIWFQPSGLYAGYNTPSDEASGFFSLLAMGLRNVISGPFLKAPVALTYYVPVAVAVITLGIAIWAVRKWPVRDSRGGWLFVAAGVVMLVLAVAPYAAVGKAPGNGMWDTRHQLLVPFGGAFVVMGLLKTLMRPKAHLRAIGSVLLAVWVAGSVAIMVNSYINYERDWLKSQALMVAFGANPEIRDSHYLLIDDETLDWDYTQHRLFYEYSGILTETFGDQGRVGILRKYYFGEKGRVSRYRPYRPYYKMGDFPGGAPDLLVDIKREDAHTLKPSTRVLALSVRDWTDREALREAVGSSIRIETRPWTLEDDRRAARALYP